MRAKIGQYRIISNKHCVKIYKGKTFVGLLSGFDEDEAMKKATSLVLAEKVKRRERKGFRG